MKICLVATGDVPSNPRLMTLVGNLTRSGHDTWIVCAGRARSTDPDNIVRLPSRVPDGKGKVRRTLRQLQPLAVRQRSLHRRLVSATVALDPDLIYAASAGVVPVAVKAADRCNAAVSRDPRFPDAGDRDIVRLAPGDLRYSSSPAGDGALFHTLADDRESWTPAEGRHTGTVVVIAYRFTETNPGRYLRSALERAGVDVRHVGDHLDWSTIGSDVDFVVFVESPYPAIEVTGDNPGIPVLLWAHHGEHHTGTHLRLIRRYGVHAVLLAHSWHLAHHYPVPVNRFPFAVAPEMTDDPEPWPSRPFDVAFVGSLGTGSGPYDARRKLLTSLGEAFPSDRVRFTDAASPEEMARIYDRAKVVVNDGGDRHYPITMRVFESIGSGALLVTDDAPGLSCLFTVDRHYVVLDVDHPGEQVRRLTEGQTPGGQIADSAHQHALGRHLYDHRVDDLIEIAKQTSPAEIPGWERPINVSDLAEAIDEYVEISTVAAYGARHLRDELPLRSVWLDPTPGVRRYDAVVIGDACDVDVEDAVADAARYVVIGDLADSGVDLDLIVNTPDRHVRVVESHNVVIVDLGTPGYRIPPVKEN